MTLTRIWFHTLRSRWCMHSTRASSCKIKLIKERQRSLTFQAGDNTRIWCRIAIRTLRRRFLWSHLEQWKITDHSLAKRKWLNKRISEISIIARWITSRLSNFWLPIVKRHTVESAFYITMVGANSPNSLDQLVLLPPSFLFGCGCCWLEL
jgi:hypothetical protein